MSKLTPLSVYTLSRTLAGLEVNGDTEALPEAIRRFTTIYQDLPEDARQPAWQAFLAARAEFHKDDRENQVLGLYRQGLVRWFTALTTSDLAQPEVQSRLTRSGQLLALDLAKSNGQR